MGFPHYAEVLSLAGALVQLQVLALLVAQVHGGG